MSDLVEFEDLGLLDGGDLRAVLSQVTTEQAVQALAAAPAWLRQRLLTKLPLASAGPLAARLDAQAPASLDALRDAQRAVVEALCRLSRAGHVAFDDPEDLLDMVA